MLRKILEQIAPPHLAYDKDPIGLQIGSWSRNVSKILVSLDMNEAIVDEAITIGAELIVCHHAPFYKPLSNILVDTPTGKMIEKLIKNNISVYVAHTNLDIVEDGVNDALANALGIENIEILEVTKKEKMKKLVVFVPEDTHQQVLQAISDAGAGQIGNYSHCSFNISGTGTFKPLAGSNPFIGSQGELEKVKEIRIETIIPEGIQAKVVQNMLNAHPYEEVAYDIYPLEIEGSASGIGRIGSYEQAMQFSEFLDKVKLVLNLSTIQVAGPSNKLVKKVAVCGGSGSKFIANAIQQQADVYITGDVTYHDAQWAEQQNLTILNAGHYPTEAIIVPKLTAMIQKRCNDEGCSIQVIPSIVNTDPFHYM
ncbi:Nif3-like dinuclear metal center hexameric protein [Desulfuribacillus stibiiarsenatis]|uniref:GTP cyclohydrolase 1 type 2 homolog n=1 Tax=Desulfuribacillus stibiiarsenatis TaxID=1390249 RepID=A0A1E5L8A0_9FIRM|nr:Nif3-like dinuclear metal center hexameric protein [Desulfuribacillus stibiiarsenatis]OEH86173.1 Nif3-like dinuclear metal center hexameric protein [Desulfuribacillus stibiiarsenatis]